MPRSRTVAQGDCVDSLALQEGTTVARIWDLPANADLKALRTDPNVLLPGDALTIPDNTAEQHLDKETRRRHTFRLLPRTRELRITTLRGGRALEALDYTVEVDDATVPSRLEGATIVCTISMDAKRAVVRIVDGGEYDIDLGHLDPLDTPSGEERRLRDLGYFDHLPDTIPATREHARTLFERTHALQDAPALAHLGGLVGDPAR